VLAIETQKSVISSRSREELCNARDPILQSVHQKLPLLYSHGVDAPNDKRAKPDVDERVRSFSEL
jgi:hypothetical protein